MFGNRLRSTVGLFFLSMLWCAYGPFVLNELVGQELDASVHVDRGEAPLVWDNVRDAASWQSGPGPKYSPRSRCSVVTLPPGVSTEVVVPAWSLVRVQVCAPQSADASQLQIWTTNGSGFFRRLPAVRVAGQNGVLAMPDEGKPSVARIVNPESAACPVTVSIYLSRRAEKKLLDIYQCPVLGRGCEVTVQTGRGDPALTYRRVAAHDVCDLDVAAPCRIRVEGRLLYGKDPVSRQTFWIRVFCGDRLLRVLSFDTIPQRHERIFLDGCETLLGRREFGYVDIPDGGGPIRIVSSHPALLRVHGVGLNLCRPQINMLRGVLERDDPYDVVSLWQSGEFDRAALALSQLFLVDDPSPTRDLDPVLNPWMNQQRIIQMARDHRIQHGGLRAYMWLRVMASLHCGDVEFGDEVSVAELAARLRGFYTRFRNLLPEGPIVRLASRYFVERDIRLESRSHEDWIIGQPHIASTAGGLASVVMSELGADEAPVRTFAVPDGLGDSILRVMVDRSQLSCDARLMLQFDDRPPIELAVMREPTLPPDRFHVSLPEAGLAALAWQHRRYDRSTLGGPFAVLREPGKIYPCATGEMLLPHDVKKIQIWTESPVGSPLLVGLQYLDGRKIELSESEVQALRAIVRRGGVEAADDSWALRELHNDLVPFENWVTIQSILMDDSVGPSWQTSDPVDLWDPLRLKEWSSQSQLAAQRQQWAAAIEKLSDIINHSRGEPRRLAILARINALESAGETYLAELERRGWCKYGDDEVLRRQILESVRNADRPDRWERVEKWMAWARSMEILPEAEQEQALAEALINQGRFRFALLLLADRVDQPELHELLLRAAYQEGWWDLFETVASRMEDASQAQVWRALRCLRDGDYRRAHQLLVTSGQAGQAWLQHWQQGHLIYQQLTDDKASVRLAAIREWSQWWESTPGPRQWKPDEHGIVAAAGSRDVKSVIREIDADHYVARPTHPVKIRLFGPAVIRLELRAIISRDSPGPVEEWVRIQSGSGGSTDWVPLLNSAPSRTLVMVNDDRMVGTAERVEIHLVEGMNELMIQPARADILVRWQRSEPEIALPVLPPLNMETVAAALTGRWGPSQTEVAVNGRRLESDVRVVNIDPACSSCSIDWNACRWRTEELRQAERAIDPWFEDAEGHVAEETATAGAAPSSSPTESAPGGLVWRRPVDAPVVLVGRDELLRRAIEVYHRMRGQEKAVLGDSKRYLVELYDLVSRAPARPDLMKLKDAASRDWTWQSLEQFDVRAGFVRVPIDGWHPETPGLRVRRSLMPDDVGDAVLVGDARFELRTEDAQPINIRLEFQRLGPGFAALGPVVGQVVVDDRPPQSIVLNDQGPLATEWHLEPGSHVVATQVVRPLVNHVVAVVVSERSGDGRWVAFDQRRPWPLKRYRTYQVATPDEPLVVTLDGPRVIRVDWTNGDIVQSEIRVLRDRQTLTLPHRASGNQTYYRLFELLPSGALREVYRLPAVADAASKPWVDEVVQTAHETVSVPDSDVPLETVGMIPPDMPAPAVAIEESEWLGAQQLGTWSYGIGYRQRRAFDEFPNLGVPGRFLFGRMARDYFDAPRNTRRHDEFEVRPRIEAGTTFGFRHSETTTLNLLRERIEPRIVGWSDWKFRWELYGFVQRAGTPRIALANATPWLVGVRTRFQRTRRWSEQLTTYRSWTFFARELSEDVNAFGPGDLDQDVFTTYKRNHRVGLRWSDQWVYQTCLDRRWWVRPLLASNEDEWIPDHASIQLGTDRLLGPLQLQLAYRWTSFFADNDRSQTTFQNLLSLQMVLEQWTDRCHRSELAFSMRYDVDQRNASLSLSLTRFINAARGYRDLGSVPFRSIRQARAIQHDNAIGL